MLLADMAQKITTSKREIWIQIFAVFILPILLIKFHIVPLGHRIWVLVLLVTLLMMILHGESWTLSMMGIHKKWYRDLLPYTLFTAVCVLGIIMISHLLDRQILTTWWKHPHFLYMFFVVSLFQEFAYRGYLMPALAKITSSTSRIILLNTLLFTFLHVIFPDLIYGLPLAFVGGICFALMYKKYPNLPLIIIAHAILNFTVVLFGFFTIPGFL